MGKRERKRGRERGAGEENFKQFLPRNEVIALLVVEKDAVTTKTTESAKMTARLDGSPRNSLDASCFADAGNNAVAPRLVFVNLPWHLNNGK